MFPVGNLRKPIVKEIAAEIGLQSIAVRREVSYIPVSASAF